MFEEQQNSEAAPPPASPNKVLPNATDIFSGIKRNDVDHLRSMIEAFPSFDEAQRFFNSVRTDDADSLPPVSFAIVHKCRDAFCLLLSYQPPVPATFPSSFFFFVSPFLLDEAKWNALTFAVESNNVEAVKILLDFVSTASSESRSLLVNQRTTEDWFPLTYAIVNGNVEIVKMLLQVPEVDLKATVDDMSHKEIAEMRKYMDIVKLLEEKES